MTYGPEADAEYDDETGGLLSEPSTLAFIAFPLAVLVLLGAQVFRGVTYTLAFSTSDDTSGGGGSTGYIVAGAFLSAAFALVPLLVGLRGLQRVIPADPAWVSGLLRASVVLGSLALGLRLLAALILAVKIDGSGGSAFGYLGFL